MNLPIPKPNCYVKVAGVLRSFGGFICTDLFDATLFVEGGVVSTGYTCTCLSAFEIFGRFIDKHRVGSNSRSRSFSPTYIELEAAGSRSFIFSKYVEQQNVGSCFPLDLNDVH